MKKNTIISCSKRLNNNIKACKLINILFNTYKESCDYIEMFVTGKAILYYPNFQMKEISIDTDTGFKYLEDWYYKQCQYWNALNSNGNGHRLSSNIKIDMKYV